MWEKNTAVFPTAMARLGKYRTVQNRGSKMFCPPPQNRVKLFDPPYYREGGHFLPPPPPVV